MEGVLGLSWAFSLPLHDVVSGTAVDYMHCICEGAIEQHLNARFEDKSGNQYLGNSVSEVDNALLSIKPIFFAAAKKFIRLETMERYVHMAVCLHKCIYNVLVCNIYIYH